MHNALLAGRCRLTVPAPAARGSVAATADVRMGMRAGRRASYSGASASGHFTGTPTRSPCACAEVAWLRACSLPDASKAEVLKREVEWRRANGRKKRAKKSA